MTQKVQVYVWVREEGLSRSRNPLQLVAAYKFWLDCVDPLAHHCAPIPARVRPAQELAQVCVLKVSLSQLER